MKKILSFLSVLLVILVVSSSCNKSNKNKEKSSPNKVDIDAIAKEKYKSNYALFENETSEYTLVKKAYSARQNDPHPTILSMIIENATGEVIYSESTLKGTVSWESKYVVKYSSLPGIPNSEEASNDKSEHYYHVQNRKKFSGKFFQGNSKKS